MIDGIKILIALIAFNDWANKVGIHFATPIDMTSGEMLGRRQKSTPENISYIHTGKFESFNLKVTETHYYRNGVLLKKGYYLTITGSLHKNHFGGRNFERFTFNHLSVAIWHLCNALYLDPTECVIQNLEIGVNLRFPRPVTPFINNRLLLHSTTTFLSYLPDKTGMIIGKAASHRQYSIKVYDKGLQFGLHYELLRIEFRGTKMQCLKQYKIETLADLLIYEKIKELSGIIITNWDLVFICDPDITPDSIPLSISNRELLRNGTSLRFWNDLHSDNPKKFSNQRAKYKKLVAQHGKLNYHAVIRDLLIDELAQVLKFESFLPCANNRYMGVDILTLQIKEKDDSRTNDDPPDRPAIETGRESDNHLITIYHQEQHQNATPGRSNASHEDPAEQLADVTWPRPSGATEAIDLCCLPPLDTSTALPPGCKFDNGLEQVSAISCDLDRDASVHSEFETHQSNQSIRYSTSLEGIDEHTNPLGNTRVPSAICTVDGIPSMVVKRASSRIAKLIMAGGGILARITEKLFGYPRRRNGPP